jgi:uncharacterized protein (DUF433 family)
MQVNVNGLERITIDPNVMGGKPTIRNTRVTVGTVLRLLGGGTGPDEILKHYPYLEAADIQQSLSFATWKFNNEKNISLKLPNTFFDKEIDIQKLAKEQQSNTTSFNQMLGNFWPEEDSVDEFMAMISKLPDQRNLNNA